MIAQYFWEAGSIIIAILASLHLYYTFFTNKFSSRNERLIADMQASSPILTKDVTMWNAWIGFNASHSAGGIFIGVINFYLANQYFAILEADHFFFLFNILTICFYVWVARKYWFKTPFIGLVLTLICFIIAYLVTMLNRWGFLWRRNLRGNLPLWKGGFTMSTTYRKVHDEIIARQYL